VGRVTDKKPAGYKVREKEMLACISLTRTAQGRSRFRSTHGWPGANLWLQGAVRALLWVWLACINEYIGLTDGIVEKMLPTKRAHNFYMAWF